MTVSFRCLMCGADLQAADTLRGTQTECGACGAEVLVPTEAVTATTPVIRRGTAAVGSRSESARSVFRSKRKAQAKAEAAGEEFDAGDFDGRREWKVPFAVVTVLALALISYLGYLAIPPARVPLTDEEASALLRTVQSDDWEIFLRGQLESAEKLNAVMVYVRNDATYEEVFQDLKRLSDIILLEPVADENDLDEMNRDNVNRMMGIRQMGVSAEMNEHLTRIRDLNPSLANRMVQEIPAFALFIQ